MILQIIHGITLSMYVRLKQDCFVKLNERKKEEKKEKKRRGGSNQPWPGPFWSKLQQSLQNKSTLEPTLLLLVIVSRIVSSRNRFRSFLQPASAPKRKAFTQKEFLRVIPVRPFICEGKTCFHKQNKKTVNCQLLSYQRHRSHANYSVLFGISRDTPQYKSIICGIESLTNCKKCIPFEEIYYL